MKGLRSENDGAATPKSVPSESKTRLSQDLTQFLCSCLCYVCSMLSILY